MANKDSPKTALVTGGSSGVGLYIVRNLARQGYRVFFIGSNKAKGEAVQAEVAAGAKAEIRFIQLDLSDVRAVAAFVKNFAETTDRLDLLANVAGVLLPKRQETKDGLEMTFTIGYLSPFILCNGLLPLLRKSAPARIVNVAGRPSWVRKAKPDMQNLNLTQGYKGAKAALTTLHCKAMLTQTLAEQLAGDHITANCFHPGMVRSGLTRNFAPPLRWLAKTINLFTNPASPVALSVCTSPEYAEVTGQFFEPHGYHPINMDAAARAELWKRTEELLRPIIPSI